MTKIKKVAFFAPIKPPDHPIPSGDRLIAQNLIKALEVGGYCVQLASRYICYSKRHDQTILEERKSGALEEADQLVTKYLSNPMNDRPEVWITYHPYCKAPDWIGPIVTKALNIPYITIEAARTGQGDETDPWKLWRQEAQLGIRRADLHLVFKPSDREYLTRLLGSDEKLRSFPTFVDLKNLTGTDAFPLPKQWNANEPVLVTAGMMRKGKKDRNFYILAEILSGLADKDWNLIVIGGGPEEDAVRAAFSGLKADRIHWTGQLEHAEVLKWMRSADLFIWPGWKEPIGMVYLEAQAQGLPVLAYNSMGVPLVVEHEKTGLLAPEGDIEMMRQNIIRLLSSPAERTEMSEAARAKVSQQHSLDAASKRFAELLDNITFNSATDIE